MKGKSFTQRAGNNTNGERGEKIELQTKKKGGTKQRARKNEVKTEEKKCREIRKKRKRRA